MSRVGSGTWVSASAPPIEVAGSFKITATATVAIMSLAEAKRQVRVDGDHDDTIIARKVAQAKVYCERVLRRSLLNTTYELVLDSFPSYTHESLYWDARGNIRLPRPPLSSVSSIKYITTASATATLATTVYGVDTHAEPGRVYLKYGQVWPSTQNINNAVKITFVGGYGTAPTSVPSNFLACVELMFAHLYESREAVAVTVGGNVIEIPLGLRDMLYTDRNIEL